jgi:polyhydroxyalkanoate synthesis regulator phasin
VSDAFSHADYLRLVNAAANGKRPYFFDNPDIDRLIAILLAMAGELAVTRERLDTVERLLAKKGSLTRNDIDAFRPDASEAIERGQWHLEYLARIFRVLQQEQELLARGAAEPSSEEVSKELAR